MAKDERVNLLSFTGSCEVGDITVTMAQIIVGLDPTKPEIFCSEQQRRRPACTLVQSDQLLFLAHLSRSDKVSFCD